MSLLVEKHASKTVESEKQSDEAGEDYYICPTFITKIMPLHLTVNVNRARAGRPNHRVSSQFGGSRVKDAKCAAVCEDHDRCWMSVAAAIMNVEKCVE
jgi:hypothetical protein